MTSDNPHPPPSPDTVAGADRPVDERALRRVVEAVRDRVAQADLSAAHPCIISFPRGACGATCDVLATVVERRFGVFPYWVSPELEEGEDWSSHAWPEAET